MHFKQGDLFWGMSKEFVQEAMDTSEKLSCDERDILFKRLAKTLGKRLIETYPTTV